MSKNKKLVFMALLVAQAIILGLIEKSLPLPTITPGAKLGLANIITVLALYLFTFNEVFVIVLLRVIFLAIFGGNMSSFFYSLAGGMLSLCAMYITMKIFKDSISTIGVSVVGAVFHNIGQTLVASFVIHDIRIAALLPLLLVSAVGTGIFVGMTAGFFITRVRKLPMFSG